MPHLAHLPSAMRLEPDFDVSTLDDVTLRVMIEECDAWQREADGFRSEISSTSTLAVWRALVERDRASVEEMCRRLHDELERRGGGGEAF